MSSKPTQLVVEQRKSYSTELNVYFSQTFLLGMNKIKDFSICFKKMSCFNEFIKPVTLKMTVWSYIRYYYEPVTVTQLIR